MRLFWADRNGVHACLQAQKKAPSTAAGVDSKAGSLLEFEGGAHVHGLFEWLLAEGAACSGAGGEPADVPLLLAPVPFLGATIHLLQPQV